MMREWKKGEENEIRKRERMNKGNGTKREPGRMMEEKVERKWKEKMGSKRGRKRREQSGMRYNEKQQGQKRKRWAKGNDRE